MQEPLGNANNLWVFRDGKAAVSGNTLRRQLTDATTSVLIGTPTTRRTINALLRAGEFESALGDTIPEHVSPAETLTNLLARCLWDDAAALAQLSDAAARLHSIPVPEELRVSPPEGFAYYALHPMDFAKLADHVAEQSGSAAIIGIRSIGTTLSAIVLAAFQRKRLSADRITVRPQGHPYDRVTRFTAEQIRWLETRLAAGSRFLVVDEGPGRSGSSFLSVAEFLERAGVPVDRITLIGSRPIDPDDLCATDAPARWRRFRFVWPRPAMYARFDHDIYVGGGEWRKTLLNRPSSDWPCCWPQMERFKFLSADRKWLYKFDGFGHFGEDVLQRVERIADRGFGPPAEYGGDGMIQYPFIGGEILDRSCVSRTLLDRIAEYCAFRASEFRVLHAPSSQVAEMLRFNVHEEFGLNLDLDLSPLSSTNTLADGRMQPHEWAIATNGELLKFDGCTHGDDHFFPGPTDIAWDLAGAIIEWDLDDHAAAFLLSRYYHLTGDNVTSRLRPFLLAYSVFRMSYCMMALSSVAGTPDHSRLERAAELYRRIAQRQLEERPSRVTALLDRVPQSVSVPGALTTDVGPA
jgi:hypothetical protein